MNAILTSNQLTEIYGQPPTDPRDASKIERGCVIYLEVGGRNGPLFARIFWTKYNHDGAPADQRKFVSLILDKAKDGGLKNLPITDKPITANNFHAFSKDISTIKFGWKPINVSYVLNTAAVRFQSKNLQNNLEQPIIFRRDKIVKGKVQRYLANHSFFNLDTYSEDSATIIEFSNHMLIDEAETFIGEPPENDAQRAEKFYPYCLDIPMDFNQSAIFGQMLSEPIDAVGDQSPPDGGILSAITFVFDPPQGNGGGGGIPDRP